MRYVLAALLIAAVIAFYSKTDISCTANSVKGPTLEGTILLWGCK